MFSRGTILGAIRICFNINPERGFVMFHRSKVFSVICGVHFSRIPGLAYRSAYSELKMVHDVQGSRTLQILKTSYTLCLSWMSETTFGFISEIIGSDKALIFRLAGRMTRELTLVAKKDYDTNSLQMS